MRNLRYREFLALVLEASGPFSYQFCDRRSVVDPVLYLARNWPNGIPDRAFTMEGV